MLTFSFGWAFELYVLAQLFLSVAHDDMFRVTHLEGWKSVSLQGVHRQPDQLSRRVVLLALPRECQRFTSELVQQPVFQVLGSRFYLCPHLHAARRNFDEIRSA